MRRLLFISLFLLSAICVSAQESRYSIDTLTIFFPFDSHKYEPSYMGNQEAMEKLQSLQNLHSITFRVTSSPEGDRVYNQMLSQRRAHSLAEYFKANNIAFGDMSEIVVVDEAWDELTQMVRECEKPWRSDVLMILENVDNHKEQLEQYNNGAVWRWLTRNWFPSLRSFTVIAKIENEIPVTETVAFSSPQVKLELPGTLVQLAQPVQPVEPVQPVQQSWARNLTVKTNALGLGLGLINVAAEIDLAPHWSVALPFYYSGGYDYFKSTIKFRGIVLQPEVRYYLRGNDGFYAGVHFGLGWYNYALNGEYRIQDHKGQRPAVGGGIATGYSFDFKKYPQWGMEFSIGAGVYDAKYDVFFNEPNGAYAEHGVHRTFFGIDNASVSLTYKFPLKKEGRK